MKRIIIIFLLMLASCANMPAYAQGVILGTPTGSNMRPIASQGLSKPSDTSTPTVDTFSTVQAAQNAQINAEMTAQVAQSQIDAINIQVAQITAQAESVGIEKARYTQEAYSVAVTQTAQVVISTQQAHDATSTAYLTSIPLTATQQAAINTQIPQQQILMSARMTATHEAPEVMNSMTRAEMSRQYGWVDTFVRLFAMFSLSLFLLSISAFSLWQIKRTQITEPEPQPEPEPEPVRTYNAETVLTVKTDHGAGFDHTERMVIPCGPDQFTKLVTGVLNEGRSLAFNVWEGANEPFTRDEFTAVRNWLLSNRLAQSVGQGKLILSAIGESLFIEWLNNQVLPETYKFEEKQ